MKRVYNDDDDIAVAGDVTGPCTAFFSLDISVECILDAWGTPGPSVWLVALLLRLNKRTRRLIWDYFRSLGPGRIRCTKLREDIWNRRALFHDKTAPGEAFWTMHPCFIMFPNTPLKDTMQWARPARLIACDVVGDEKNQKHVALYPGQLSGRVEHDMSIGCATYQHTYVDRNKCLFAWYLVADALCIAWDALILSAHRAKWDPAKPTCDDDCHSLFICPL